MPRLQHWKQDRMDRDYSFSQPQRQHARIRSMPTAPPPVAAQDWPAAPARR